MIVVDKGRTPARLSAFAGALSLYELENVHLAPWSPTVEETRSFALNRCSHDWVVCLDDDELLSPACAETFHHFVASGQDDILDVPIRHHVLGRHDARACYWPEWRPTLFRRGAIRFGETVHAGVGYSGRVVRLPEDHPAHVVHLSHPDVATWVEKTNRYTSQPNRTGVAAPPSGGFVPWALERLSERVRSETMGDDYLDAVALLHGLYAIVDGLKRWETTQADGRVAFEAIARAEIERHRCAA